MPDLPIRKRTIPESLAWLADQLQSGKCTAEQAGFVLYLLAEEAERAATETSRARLIGTIDGHLYGAEGDPLTHNQRLVALLLHKLDGAATITFADWIEVDERRPTIWEHPQLIPGGAFDVVLVDRAGQPWKLKEDTTDARS